MKLHQLKPAKGSTKKSKRIARGQGSGHGGTSTRGHKGAKSRSGYKSKRNFEGGQMPIQMRLPKRGFKNPNRIEYIPINVGRLEEIAEKHGCAEINIQMLKESGTIRRTDKVKILGSGSISKKLSIEAHAFSNAAKTAIEEAGGSISVVQ